MADSSLYKMAHLCELIARTPWPDILLGCVRDDPDGNRMICRLLMLWTAPPPARECHGCGRC
jgi:hypothetical protein